MLKRLTTLLILLPLGIIILFLAVANRQGVTLVVPPVDDLGQPLASATIPVYALVFIALFIGMIIGSTATWVKQGRHRKTANERKVEATKAQFEAQRQKERADALAARVADEDGAGTNHLALAPPPKRAA